MIPTFTKNGLLCFAFWLPVYANPRAGSVDVFLSSMLFETMGERRWLQKRREGKFDKSHGRAACEHLRMISGSWRISRQPGIGCIASFCLHAGFSHWRVFAVAAYEWRMSCTSTPDFDGCCAWLTPNALLTDGYPMDCATLGGLLGLCGHRREVLCLYGTTWKCVHSRVTTQVLSAILASQKVAFFTSISLDYRFLVFQVRYDVTLTYG